VLGDAVFAENVYVSGAVADLTDLVGAAGVAEHVGWGYFGVFG